MADTMTYEQELADYLQERIKPGLNSGAIPMLARSIAKDIAKRAAPADATENGSAASEDEDDPTAEADEQPEGEAEDEPEPDDAPEGETDDEPEDEQEDEPEAAGDAAPDFETEMHELQEELGKDWIVRFSVQGKDEWLTAEKEDGSQRVEAETADVLIEAVELLNERGRST